MKYTVFYVVQARASPQSCLQKPLRCTLFFVKSRTTSQIMRVMQTCKMMAAILHVTLMLGDAFWDAGIQEVFRLCVKKPSQGMTALHGCWIRPQIFCTNFHCLRSKLFYVDVPLGSSELWFKEATLLCLQVGKKEFLDNEKKWGVYV